MSSAIGHSRVLFATSLVLLWAAEACRRLRFSADENYQSVFRDQVTRDWFHLFVPGGYLARPSAEDELSLEVKKDVREACLRATDQNPDRTTIEERLFFEPDSHQTAIYILRERSRWSSRVVSRAIVWRHAASVDASKVAVVWPPSPGSVGRAPDVRFFDNGKPVPATEPLQTKLMSLYDLVSRAAGSAGRVAVSPSGVWAGCRLPTRPLTAPVTTTCLDPDAYSSWPSDLALLNNREIVRALHLLGS